MARYKKHPTCLTINGKRPCELVGQPKTWSKRAEACLFRESRAKMIAAFPEDSKGVFDEATRTKCLSTRTW